ncbi:uncharacterized protein KIAA0825-like [Lytechinus variegatus]|uniref:uncharacterized protein KIAA0825-like n=1 Tax=Lytechinus variegatus TaxID=7654 RepID=UPI001BB196C3|nr:uncharacterized protein KIAA0825-like [Lytechinus variegatus]
MSQQCVLPSLTAMFQFGMPSMDNLEMVITDIDEQLKQNDKKIEETLQKLVQATNSLSLDNNYTNIKDAMDSLIQTPVLEECACLTPDTEDVNKLLKAILQHAVNHPNSEAIIFEQLLGLASHEGLGLPIRAPKPSYVAASAVSINTIGDSLEQENDSLWEEIRSRLKRYFLDRLHAIKVSEPGEWIGPLSKAKQVQRIESLQSLCILYPIKEVWSSYHVLASDKVATFLRENLSTSNVDVAEPRQPATLASIADKLQKLTPHFHVMLEDECALYLADVFEGEVNFLQAVQEIYLSQLQEEVASMMEEACEGIRRGGAKGTSSSNGSATKSIGARDWLNGGHEHGKEQTKKKSVVDDSVLMSLDDIKHYIMIVALLHDLNQRLCQLSQHATWEGAPLFKPQIHSKGNLRGVLKHNRDGGPMRDPRMPSEHTGRGVLPEAIPPPFGVMPGMVGSDYGGRRSSPVLESPSHQRSKWNWSSVVENMTSLVIRSITKISEDMMKASCSEEENKMKKEKKVQAVECDVSKGLLSQPYMICKSASLATDFISSVLSLVMLGVDKVLQPVRAGVLEMMSSSIMEVYQHLTKLLEIFNQSSSESGSIQGHTRDLCVLLSSSVWLQQELTSYKRLLGEEEAKRFFGGVEKQLSQLETVVQQQIISSHVMVVSTVILQDAESHNWADQRPFFEDERCSYSVQMWHLYLQRLQHELFTVCPPSQSQQIFASVLSESITLLSYRYNKGKPSYKRTRQFRADITSVLLTTLTHLWSACSTPQQLVSPQSLLSSTPHYPLNSSLLNIHNSASCLLGALAVVTSPLSDLYKIYKKGYQKKSVTHRSTVDKEGAGSMDCDQRVWLAWIRPALFEQLEQGWNFLPDKIASFILLKLLANQPALNDVLTLQTLLSRDALLATLMMSNTGASVRYELSSILQPLIDVLVLCSDHPTTLGSVLMAVIEKQDNWPMFRYDSLPGKTTSVPDWLLCLFTVLRPFIHRGVLEAGEVLMKPRGYSETSGFLETLGELPCGCRPKHRTTGTASHKQEKDTMFGALKAILRCIAEDLIALPTTLKVFFFLLQERLQSNSIRSCHNCVALQIIGSCVYATLSDEQEVRRIVGDSVPEAIIKKFSQLGDYTFLSLTATSNHGTQEKLPNPLHTFINLNSDWLQEQIDIIIDHLGNESLGDLTNYNWDESSLGFVDDYYKVQADNVNRMKDGAAGLKKISILFRNNLAWFQHHLDIPPLLQTEETLTIPIFNPDTTPTTPSDIPTPMSFNPLFSFKRIDDSPFSHETIAEYPYDWPKLLQADLGLSEAGFRSLLSHRFEMQEDANLEESERKPVRVLRSKFDLDKGDLV